MAKYDIAIIGSGPGGYVAALYAAKCGKKVVLIEKDLIGGVCLNRGCIPTKTLIATLAEKDNLGLSDMVAKKDKVVTKLRSGVEGLLRARAVDIKKGEAKLIDKSTLEVASERIEAKTIIIATGSRPVELPTLKFDGKKILSSSDMLKLTEKPQHLLIVGGGFIGCEFGYLYNSLGAEVTIVEMLDRLIPVMAKDLSKAMELVLKKKKVKVLTKTKADAAFAESFDKVLVSIGRRANIENIGLEKAGIKTEKGYIAVNRFLQTNIENVYAIGDVIGGKMLAHVASHEGITAVDNILGKKKEMDYTISPDCIYTEPQIASVGLTKEQAESKGYKVKIAKFPFSACGKAQAIGKTEGFVKMVGDESTGVILGVHIVGPEATDLIAEAGLMVKFKMKAADVADTIHAHPTLSEALMEAAFVLLGKPIHTL